MSPLVSGVDFVLLPTRDLETASEFYGSVLGLPCSARYERAPGAEFETGSLTLQVLEVEKLGLEFHVARNPVALRVDDVAEARSQLEAEGVQFAADTIDSGVCHMAFFNDPDGNALMLHHRYAPRDA
jgi:catechol 2,3-dioxygenase-like lactoylglutathione lyase family enzyme